MVKHVLSEIQNNEPLAPTSVKQHAPCVTPSKPLVPIAVKRVKLPLKSTPIDSCQDQNRAETTTPTSGMYEALSYASTITMNLASPQTILASLQTLVEAVMQHPNSEQFSDAQMNLLNRIQDDVRLCKKENKNMVNAPDAHTKETIPAKLLLFTLNLKDGIFFYSESKVWFHFHFCK